MNCNVEIVIHSFVIHLNDVLNSFLYGVKVVSLEFINVDVDCLFDFIYRYIKFHLHSTVDYYDVIHLRLIVLMDVVLHHKVFSFNESYNYVYHITCIVDSWFQVLFLFSNVSEVVD